jgi:hypothetical protein
MSNTLDPHVASVLDQAGSDDEDAVSTQIDYFRRSSWSMEQYEVASVRFVSQSACEPYSLTWHFSFVFHYLYII